MLKLDKRYTKYFLTGPDFRYNNFLKFLKIEINIRFDVDSFESNQVTAITITLNKSSWKISHSVNIFMLDTLDNETLEYYMDQMYLNMIADLNRVILDEIKL